jgi:type IX secretion system PorP/SprF family membrane protein
MKTIKSTVLIVCLGFLSNSFAQQLPLSSQYHQNGMTINPALTGSSEYTEAAASHRSMLTGVQGGPQTSYLSLQGQVASGKMGLGLIAYHDQTSILSTTSAMVNYAYKVKLTEDAMLNFGLGVGIQNFAIDFANAAVVDNTDPLLFGQRQNRISFNGEFGTALVVKGLELGFAIPQLFSNNPSFQGTETELLNYNTIRHFRGTIKYDIFLNEGRTVKFYPMFVARSVKGAPFQYDINGILDIQKAGWIGVTYHSMNSVSMCIGVRYKGVSIGYAHDFSIGNTTSYTKRSSEILLKYQIQNRSNKQEEWNKEMERRAKSLENESENQQEEIDALKKEQEEADAKLKKAEKELEELKKNPRTNGGSGNGSSAQDKVDNPTAETVRNNYRTAKASDFVDEQGNTPEKGFYVVVGAFGVKENAENWKKITIQNGEKNTKILYNSTLQVREVYIYYSSDRDPAMVERMRIAPKQPSVWVQKLE